jgi:hypothetical protein
MLVCALVLCSTVAFAQSAPPPMVGDKPLLQVKPKEGAKAAVKGSAKENAKDNKGPPTGKSIATRLQSCQDIDDLTKERLTCYDEVLKPAPKPKPAAAKTVMDCKYIKEEDARLTCYNGFVDSMPKMPKSS